MKMFNEALRMFLAISALILTAMLTNPTETEPVIKTQLATAKQAKKDKKSERRFASQDLKDFKIGMNRFRR